MTKEEMERMIRSVRDEAITSFATLNANLNKAVAAMTGQPAPSDTVHPTRNVSVWEGSNLEQLAELIAFMRAETTDEDERVIILRALAVYRSHVSHVKAGGTVLYVPAPGSDAKPKTLKVRLR